MRIKIGELREEERRLGREIAEMQRQQKAIRALLDVYAPEPRKATTVRMPVVPAPAGTPEAPRPQAPPKPIQRPTGKSILVALAAQPGTCMTKDQIRKAIGYDETHRDKSLVNASISGLATEGKIRVNSLGLYELAR